jgi:hypothetical protein
MGYTQLAGIFIFILFLNFKRMGANTKSKRTQWGGNRDVHHDMSP